MERCDMCGVFDSQLNVGLCNQCHEQYKPVFFKPLSMIKRFKLFIKNKFNNRRSKMLRYKVPEAPKKKTPAKKKKSK